MLIGVVGQLQRDRPPSRTAVAPTHQFDPIDVFVAHINFPLASLLPEWGAASMRGAVGRRETGEPWAPLDNPVFGGFVIVSGQRASLYRHRGRRHHLDTRILKGTDQSFVDGVA